MAVKPGKNACPASALFHCYLIRSDAADAAAAAAAADHKATPPPPMKNARRAAAAGHKTTQRRRTTGSSAHSSRPSSCQANRSRLKRVNVLRAVDSGDREQALGFTVSSVCDRRINSVADIQIG